ncbi:ABC transporter permease [Demequina sp.]|uniref:ABC transporter permease n=1 Tax=Demequina sp. TaxID=2050685 RepID=UPI0026000E78|nr:ABC transporter permease [Demequina sp.]
MTEIDPWRVLAAVAVLAVIAIVALWTARARVGRDAAIAILRAAAQLVAVALVIGWVFRTPGAAWLYVAVMLAAATWTSVSRIKLGAGATWAIAAGIAAGAAVAVVPVVISGVLPREAQSLLPFAAQILGGSMMAVSLTGLRMRDEAGASWAEVEGWLALGARPRQAAEQLARTSVARALVPAIDQTRNAGVVVLPGAFVGLLLAGASPLEAAQVQLLVLVGLLAAESVAAVTVAQLLRARVGASRPQGVTELPRRLSRG